MQRKVACRWAALEAAAGPALTLLHLKLVLPKPSPDATSVFKKVVIAFSALATPSSVDSNSAISFTLLTTFGSVHACNAFAKSFALHFLNWGSPMPAPEDCISAALS
eukprot:CAMPEP_0174753036 /NCGR_PEP_ID=MMETSP1094-20130205/103309_1 /TAXON_ID=156173 /ORGANISM="Chrysochromulina brevifilum, Strain UTEX LB 985" /LENGTH=106 /DNA_ID=CAMNT_0015958747 /DNA_START=120 /DNA_END=438 /DNA_ORIENTATION=-